MRLTVVGSSPSWPNPGGAQSGYLVEGPRRLLLDCGNGVLARLRQTSPWPDVQAIVISHFHLDHWGDLVSWAWGALHGPGEGFEPAELHLPAGGREYLAGIAVRLGGERDLFERTFDVNEYAADQPREVAGFELVPLRVQHYRTETCGFRVSDGQATLAYSADSAPTDALVELARGSDLFLCEATLAGGEPEPRGHLTLAEAKTAFAASGSRRLLVTHRPRELPVDDGVELAREGLEIEL